MSTKSRYMYTIKANSWETKDGKSTASITVTDGNGNEATVKMEGHEDILQKALSKLEEMNMAEIIY